MNKIIIHLTQKSIGLYFNILAIINPKLLAKKGFQLFCNPMSKPLEKHQLKFLEKGKHSIIKFNNEKIQTYKWGNGSKEVLMIHGWASHTFRWKSYIENLIEKDFTVYAFDAPAHGLSSGKILHVELYTEVIDLMIQSNKRNKKYC
ncbi:MAG: alpha/beta hydrolase [Flavobacterium sp.]|nr:alpha/beta hydrolase [Flavobacterium sp.]